MYVVTGEINEYNQFGAYFIAAYQNKPTREQLKELLKSIHADTNIVEHLLRGGGRQKDEYEWFNLLKIEEGKVYTEEGTWML